MASGELNPNHYPAQRAAKVVQHYLTAHYGSPYRLFGLQKVFSGNAQVCYFVPFQSKEIIKHYWRLMIFFFFKNTADSGRKYQLELSVHELISNVRKKNPTHIKEQKRLSNTHFPHVD